METSSPSLAVARDGFFVFAVFALRSTRSQPNQPAMTPTDRNSAVGYRSHLHARTETSPDTAQSTVSGRSVRAWFCIEVAFTEEPYAPRALTKPQLLFVLYR
uniref:Putative secreted protein n=1 Tax=Anopheles triannulatus TaxID=58253 RepID=A0A2M4B6S6_9DIPT